jgi:hypothetical protein
MFRWPPWRRKNPKDTEVFIVDLPVTTTTGTEVTFLWQSIILALLTRKAMLKEWARVKKASSISNLVDHINLKLEGGELAAIASRHEQSIEAVKQLQAEGREIGFLVSDPNAEIELVDNLIALLSSPKGQLEEMFYPQVSRQLSDIAQHYDSTNAHLNESNSLRLLQEYDEVE